MRFPKRAYKRDDGTVVIPATAAQCRPAREPGAHLRTVASVRFPFAGARLAGIAALTERVTVTVLVDRPEHRTTFARIVADSGVSIPHDPATGKLYYADARGAMNPRELSRAERAARGISRKTPKRDDRVRSYTAWALRPLLESFLEALAAAGLLVSEEWGRDCAAGHSATTLAPRKWHFQPERIHPIGAPPQERTRPPAVVEGAASKPAKLPADRAATKFAQAHKPRCECAGCVAYRATYGSTPAE